MSTAKPTLAQLRTDRDRALARARESVGDARARAGLIDADIATLACNHPIAALGGALALGAAAGMLLGARPVRRLATSAGLAVFGPLIGNLSERLLRLASGEPSDEACEGSAEDA